MICYYIHCTTNKFYQINKTVYVPYQIWFEWVHTHRQTHLSRHWSRNMTSFASKSLWAILLDRFTIYFLTPFSHDSGSSGHRLTYRTFTADSVQEANACSFWETRYFFLKNITSMYNSQYILFFYCKMLIQLVIGLDVCIINILIILIIISMCLFDIILLQ